jgi:1,2-dihydroxy-3-keto-5-methylthiopentene dioxygenase
MATVTVTATGRKISADAEVGAFLAARGIEFERWPLRDGDPVAAYAPELRRLEREKGYCDVDVIRLSPETKDLETLLARFDKDHFHTDDEVRFIRDGEGVFGLCVEGGERFEILVTSGDYISIPARIWHWFALTPARRITAVRLFKDRTGWTPYYRDAAPGAGSAPAPSPSPARS